MLASLQGFLRKQLEAYPRINRVRRHWTRVLRAHTTSYPRWGPILGASGDLWPPLQREARKPRVLVATSIGSHLPGTTLESVLVAALRLRGAAVDVLLCDEALPACLACTSIWYPDPDEFARDGPARLLCRACFAPARKMFHDLGVAVHRYSALVTLEERRLARDTASAIHASEVRGYRWQNMAVGEHALAGALRFFARASLDEEPTGDAVLRRYFEAALITAFAMRRLLKQTSYEAAVFHHGIYVPQGVVGEAARSLGVRVVNWNPAYRNHCFIFSHGDTYHHTLMNEPVDCWESMQWAPEMEKQLLAYLKSRWTGTNDWIWFHESPEFNLAKIESALGVDSSRPCIGMLTNVTWDAQLHYPANAFPDMLTWVQKTIDYFSRRPDMQLVIRVHPAEIRGTLPSRQPIIAEIRRAFPVLPKNVFLIPPESRVSTYSVMGICDAVIIYGTKTGMELTSTGVPVIVAGEAWIRNKGITLDAKTEREYFELLGRLPLKKRLHGDELQRARKYAYHFFFRRMIPLDFMEPVTGWPPYAPRIKNLRPLMPGASKGLDVICDGILHGSDFIYPAEHTGGAAA